MHNLSRGSFEGEFNKKYMSTSLVTSKTMGLFSENRGNNFGFIVRPKNIVSAVEHDSWTNNSPVNQHIESFANGNIPPIKLPWEIEKRCIEQTIENSKEMLNYDKKTVYSEIVTDEFEIEAMYYRSNGEGELAPNYETARRMAEERGIELKELDISKARKEQGLEPMTKGMQRNFLCNILRKNFMSEEQIKKIYINRNTMEIEGQFIDTHYEEFYQRYLQLKNSGEYTKENILQEFQSIISDEEMAKMSNFYSKKMNEFEYETYSRKESNTEEPIKEGSFESKDGIDLWTSRFKNWYETVDKLPEVIKAKFVKMKSDIVKVIR